MSFIVNTSRVVGSLSESGGSWVHFYSPREAEKREKRGALLAVLSLERKTDGGEMAELGKEMVTRLHEEYFGEIQADAFECLRTAVETVGREAEERFECNLVAGAVVGQTLYLVRYGLGRVWLQRQGKLAEVLQGGRRASGYLQANDTVCLGTEPFFTPLSEGGLKAALEMAIPEEAAEALVPTVQNYWQERGGNEESLVAGLIVRIADEPAVPETAETEAAVEEENEGAEKESPVFRRSVLADYRSRFWLWLRINWGRWRIPLLKRGFEPRFGGIPVALAILLLLIALGWAGSILRQEKAVGMRYETLLREAQSKKEEGEGLVSLNSQKAKESLLEAQKLAEEAETVVGEEEEKTALAAFREQLEAVLGKVVKEYQVEGKLFFDLELVKAGAVGEYLALGEGKLLVLDKKQGAVYQLGIADKKWKILAGGGFVSEARGLAVGADGGAWIVTDKAIFSNNKEVFGQTGEKITAAAEYDGSLYLVDETAGETNSQGEIWKVGLAGGEAGRQGWLKEEVDLTGTAGMAIDGMVWVVGKTVGVSRLARGQKTVFALTGLERPIGEAGAVFSNEETENLYLLDRGAGRVLVFSKEGEYRREYGWEELKKATGLVALEKEGRIMVLAGSKIYEIGLR